MPEEGPHRPNPAPLLEPRSVAVVGATDRPGSYGDTVLRNLERAGFPGLVWGVHPTRTRVHGRDCVSSPAELPEPVDAVVFAIPAAKVPGSLLEAGERGCRGAVVFSAGFGEAPGGAPLERELADAAARTGIPICGPNGNGVISVTARAPLWGDSVPELRPGPVAMITQSGNLAVNAIGSRRGLDFHTIVSAGNQTVLDAADWLAAVVIREGVRSVALFLEEDGDGARLAESLALCAERGVGVAVLKVGTSCAGARAAAAHTGAIAGDQRAFRALVEEAGAAWVSDPHELLEVARVLAEPRARPAPGRSSGLAVLTCSGGDSGIAADLAESGGIELPPLAEATRRKLDELLPDAATPGNPLDYTSLIWGESELLASIVEAVGGDVSVDQLLLLYDHPAGLRPEHEDQWRAVRTGLADGAERCDAAALIASTLPDLLDDAAARELAARGIPAVAGLPTALACVRALQSPPGDPARLRAIAGAASGARAGSNGSAGGWLGEAAAKRLLRDGGLPVPEGIELDSGDEGGCVAAARELGWPVALKLSGPAVRHKSEAGALALGISGEHDLRRARDRLIALPEADGASLLVERMAEPGVELLISARTDAVVPVLTVALGGIWTEALRDAAVIPLPADAALVAGRMRSLRGAELLTGGRGGEALDLEAAAELAARLGELLLDGDLALIELNPVVVHRRGCVAVDALARCL
ncbi:MAG TPA: acetate--CoA ligase family protein [Solirubrobacterales bacterium]|nr:acetate--CoA ligase family protein [Solirubrobacterales bacterium]